ncbi:glycosyltransferase family 2 protein [Formosa haliotis]|uniref:glycosyltransferase family 2 protein n=1 Tax=Formosa haliotis TaxID=1555194 RepID=UPI00082456F8|nr:glycosyltransferase family 2 protein [Formosa haliotis]
MRFKLVSIIIPLYNSEAWLEETMNSVLNQTYKNIEVIVVDDYSTDRSFELAKQYEADNIKVVKNIRKGACAARNYGFELSEGEYIQYLDADDLLCKEKIEIQIKELHGETSEVISSGVWGRFYDKTDNVKWQNQEVNQDYDKGYKWLNDSWRGKGMGAVHCWLVPRAIIQKSGIWDEGLRINQDGEFFTRVLLNTKEIKFCKNAKVFYRSGNPNSISQSNNLSFQKAESLLKSYISYKKEVKKVNLTNELKCGLGYNFLHFIYLYKYTFPELSKTASLEFYDLGFKKMWPVGGEKFKKLSSILGFKNTLKIKSIINKINR